MTCFGLEPAEKRTKPFQLVKRVADARCKSRIRCVKVGKLKELQCSRRELVLLEKKDCPWTVSNRTPYTKALLLQVIVRSLDLELSSGHPELP